MKPIWTVDFAIAYVDMSTPSKHRMHKAPLPSVRWITSTHTKSCIQCIFSRFQAVLSSVTSYNCATAMKFSCEIIHRCAIIFRMATEREHGIVFHLELSSVSFIVGCFYVIASEMVGRIFAIDMRRRRRRHLFKFFNSFCLFAWLGCCWKIFDGWRTDKIEKKRWIKSRAKATEIEKTDAKKNNERFVELVPS